VAIVKIDIMHEETFQNISGEALTEGGKPELNKQVIGALEFIRNTFNLDINESGDLNTKPTENQLEIIRQWKKITFIDGNEMPNIDVFLVKIILARALMPQVDSNGTTQYLFGKGVGAEITLLGKIEGRDKLLDSIPYRPHSDFEIYAVKNSDYNNISNSESFFKVFGSQEIYPLEKTKGLSNLPPTFLYETCETVDLGGIKFLVPDLEIQFLDKFEKGSERTEKRLRGKTDAEFLAENFQLDSKKIHELLDNYVIPYQIEHLEQSYNVEKIINNLKLAIEKYAKAMRSQDKEVVDYDKSILYAALVNNNLDGFISKEEIFKLLSEDNYKKIEQEIINIKEQKIALLLNKHHQIDLILDKKN